MAGEAEVAPRRKRPGNRLLQFSLIMVVLTPGLTWLSLSMLSRDDAKKPVVEKVKKDYRKLGAPNDLPLPMVTNLVEFMRASGERPPFIVPTNVQPVRGIPKMVLRLANTNKIHHLVAEIFLVGKNTDALISRFNKAQSDEPKVYLAVSNLLARKTLEEARTPGFRSILRSELVQVCNAIMGPDTVQDAIIAELLTQ